MKNNAPGALLGPLTVDPGERMPLYRQVYRRIRELVLDGSLSRGSRLPSTRTLAADLGLSRNTVLAAVEQLTFEGYLISRVGDGTYVAAVLPEDLEKPRWPRTGDAGGEPQPSIRQLSRAGERLRSNPVGRDPIAPGAFAVGIPALDRFPWPIWNRSWSRFGRDPERRLLSYGEAAGYRPLRREIAAYLNAARGVRCDPEQVIVVSSSQQAIDLVARALIDPGDPVWIEEPGYLGARGALTAAGAELTPVPVDDDGLVVAAGAAARPGARLVYVTPSHQYPLGSVLSLERRLELLDWASEHDAWILEDDYDSELRFVGQPLAALQGLDRAGGGGDRGRVIYAGTFTKVMYPSLRLAYLVPPDDLVEPLLKIRCFVDRHSPTLPQAALADFMAGGHFSAHIRRMRSLYRERQECLLEALHRHLAGRLLSRPDPAGMHLVVELPDTDDDIALRDQCAARGVQLSSLSRYYLGSKKKSGLLLGYASPDRRQIEEGVERLAAVLGQGWGEGLKPPQRAETRS